jgi:hypothetical protein
MIYGTGCKAKKLKSFTVCMHTCKVQWDKHLIHVHSYTYILLLHRYMYMYIYTYMYMYMHAHSIAHNGLLLTGMPCFIRMVGERVVTR